MKVAFSWDKPGGGRLEKAETFFWNPHPRSAMVGGIRNGKTTAAVRRGIFLSLAYPGNRGLICRFESTVLQKTTLAVFKDELSRLNGGIWGIGPIIKRINENENFVILYNDSIIYWSHLDRQDSVQGGGWGWVYIDELHEVKEDTFNQIINRMDFWSPARIEEFCQDKRRLQMQREIIGRNVKPDNYFFVTQNPHTNWTKRRIKQNVDKEFWVIESTTEDNKENLPPGTYEQMLKMPKDWVKRFIEGSWDIAGGQVYKEFNSSIHVIEPFLIPSHWQRVISQDFGWSHPTAVLWTAVDEFGNLFFYDEHYASETLASEHAKVMHAKSDKSCPRFEDGLKVAADPSGRGKQAVSGRSLFEEYQEHKIYCYEANNEVSAGILRCQEYFHVDASHVHPITKQLGSPRVFIFQGRCPNLVRELVEYEWEKMPLNLGEGFKEKPRKIRDDACDAFRYGIMTRPSPSEIQAKDEPWTESRSLATIAFTKQEPELQDFE